MLGAVALLALAARLAMLFIAERTNPQVTYPVLLYIGCFATGGAALGRITGSPLRGAYMGAQLGIMTGIVVVPVIGSARGL